MLFKIAIVLFVQRSEDAPAWKLAVINVRLRVIISCAIALAQEVL